MHKLYCIICYLVKFFYHSCSIKKSTQNIDIMDKKPKKIGVPDTRHTSYNSPVYNTPSSAKSSVVVSIKKSINSVKKYITNKVKNESNKKKDNKGKKDTKSELFEKIEEIETTKLDNLEREMIKQVNDIHVNGKVSGDNIDIVKVFDDVLKNLTIELHNVLGYTEQTVAIIEDHYQEESPAKLTAKQQSPKRSEEPKITDLNEILEALANNFYDLKNKKELLFTEHNSNGGTSSYSIRHNYYGISITYSTLKEFFDKISSRVDFVMSLCWMFSCPEQLVMKIKKLKTLHSDYTANSNQIFKIFKETIKVYLDIERHKSDPRKYPINAGALGAAASASGKTIEIPEALLRLLPASTGGKKRKPRIPKNPKQKLNVSSS